MIEYGCQKYQLSIDGMRETHDWFRKPGSFDTTLEKVSCINRAGIHSVIMTTVSDRNIEEVLDIVDIAVQSGANIFAFARYCPTSGDIYACRRVQNSKVGNVFMDRVIMACSSAASPVVGIPLKMRNQQKEMRISVTF